MGICLPKFLRDPSRSSTILGDPWRSFQSPARDAHNRRRRELDRIDRIARIGSHATGWVGPVIPQGFLEAGSPAKQPGGLQITRGSFRIKRPVDNPAGALTNKYREILAEAMGSVVTSRQDPSIHFNVCWSRKPVQQGSLWAWNVSTRIGGPTRSGRIDQDHFLPFHGPLAGGMKDRASPKIQLEIAITRNPPKFFGIQRILPAVTRPAGSQDQ